jgi:cell wall-associated NlpC family hydrolase
MLLLAPVALAAGLLGAATGRAEPKPVHLSVPGFAENPAALILPPPPAPIGARAAELARRWVGVPYRYGGSSPETGFDCSGLVSYVYGRLGLDLPHNAAALFGYGRPVPVTHLRPGDLVFSHDLGHVGMYVGGGRWIHAPQSGETVRVELLSDRDDLVGARRLTLS